MSSTIVCLLAIVICAHAYTRAIYFSRSSCLISQHQTRNLPLYATSVPDQKWKSLARVKERCLARGLDGIAEVEAEDYLAFEQALEEEGEPPKKGQTVTGCVIEMDEDGVYIDIKGKMSGYMPAVEATLTGEKDMNALFHVGQEVTGEIVGTLKGVPVVSLRQQNLITAWEKISKLKAADEQVTVTVLEVNRGGAVCDLFGLKAFLPGSHHVSIPDASMIGQTLEVRFLDTNEEEGKIVVSRRRALAHSQPVLDRGSVVEGTVTGLRQYGAFVEFAGGQAGLLHVSQISNERIESLENLFTVGEKCKVMVLDHDRTNNRVALSTKTLEANPGDMLRDKATVFAHAEENAKKYYERLETERIAREAAAKDLVAGLTGPMDDVKGSRSPDPMNVVSVADSIESILAAIVSNSESKSSA